MFYVITVGGTLSGKSGLARNCVSCNVCLKKCPQSLPIPDLMKKISKEYEGFVGRNFDKAGTFLHNLKNRSIKIDKENKNTGN
jgi:predicted aldo/keto reductase-like oxidoreductase